jgi:hypothetical protein
MNDAMPSPDPLSRELSLYDARKREWLSSHLNQFVVIAGDQVEGFHPDYESAFKAGIRMFGIKRQFLIKQICVTEPVYVVY